MTNYLITEEDYFDYYQNACDPTFENYPFKGHDEMPGKEIQQQNNINDIADDLPF